MTGLAQFFLVLTSLAPIGLVQAAVQFGRGARVAGFWYLCGSALLVLVCRGLWWGVRRWNAADLRRPLPQLAAHRRDGKVDEYTKRHTDSGH